MAASVTYPVQVLREHLTGLEAAITLCLGDPSHKPVHRLRTETRRVEALLLLLALVPGLPEHRKEAAGLLRALAKLRRAAGQVRDLDVHREMLNELAEAAGPVQAQPDAAGAKQPASSSQPIPDAANASVLGDAAATLRKRMGHKREKAAAALQHLLRQREGRTARAAEVLLEALEPAQALAVSAPDLLRDAEAVLTRDGLLRTDALKDLSEDDLHTVRKAAKAARYVAESLPEDPAVNRAARGFEALQKTGGEWHDALELARAARRHFSKAHELTAFYRDAREKKLRAYRSALRAQTRSAKAVKSARATRPSTPLV